MLAVAATEADVAAALDGLAGVGIAAVNGPQAVVVSGAVDALDEVERVWRDRGVRTRRLTVSHAFHSPLMEPMLARFRAVLDKLTFAAPSLPVVSNLTGALAGDEISYAGVLRAACARGGAVRRWGDGAAGGGCGYVLEVGPRSVLTAMVGDVLPGGDAVLAVAAQARTGPVHGLLGGLAELHVRGVAVDWRRWFAETGARRVDLPTYAFQHQRYWPEAGGSAVTAVPGDAAEGDFWAAVERGDLTGVAAHLAVQDDPAAVEALAPAVPVLSSWRRARQRDAVVDGWTYRVEWEPVRPAAVPALTGRWLVVTADNDDAGVAGTLTGAGAVDTLTVAPGVDRAELTGLLRGHSEQGWAGVLCVLPATDRALPDAPAVSVGAALLLTLTQALADAGLPGRLWCLSRGAAAPGPARPSPTRGPPWPGASGGSSPSNSRTAGAAWSTCPPAPTAPRPTRCSPSSPTPGTTRWRSAPRASSAGGWCRPCRRWVWVGGLPGRCW
ncbi:acyltransferase domain-containing protein [Micromonospora sp. BRA006-A]|nr:acyltransferase domain-containing protein [Micromonospora sp. BRA006-A]